LSTPAGVAGFPHPVGLAPHRASPWFRNEFVALEFILGWARTIRVVIRSGGAAGGLDVHDRVRLRPLAAPPNRLPTRLAAPRPCSEL